MLNVPRFSLQCQALPSTETPGTCEHPNTRHLEGAWCFPSSMLHATPTAFDEGLVFFQSYPAPFFAPWRLCVRHLSLRTPRHCERNDSFIVERLTASLQTWWKTPGASQVPGVFYLSRPGVFAPLRLCVRCFSLRTPRHCERMNSYSVKRLTASLQTRPTAFR